MVNNFYINRCKYEIGDCDNSIFLFPFNESTIEYITDIRNGTASKINGECYRLYCDSVQYSSDSENNSRFAFTNTLTLVINEGYQHTFYNVIERLITEDWIWVFRTKMGEKFIVNAELKPSVTYDYNFNDENVSNVCTLTVTANQNVPTILLNGNVNATHSLRDAECDFNIGKISSLQMMDMNKVSVKVVDDDFTIKELEIGAIKNVDFLKGSLSFTDEYDDGVYTQTLTFDVPFSSFQDKFHYSLLEFMDNKYYAIIETTNGNFLFGGFRHGLFPNYSINTGENSATNNTITITLVAEYTTFSLLANDYYTEEKDVDDTYWKELEYECIDDIYTFTLIEQYGSDDRPTFKWACLESYKQKYENEGYNIIKTYKNRYDTSFGIKLYDARNDACNHSWGCGVEGLPSSIEFRRYRQVKTYNVSSLCEFTVSSDSCVETTYENGVLTVTNLMDEGTCNIYIDVEDGSRLIIPTYVDSTTFDGEQNIFITAEKQCINIQQSRPYEDIVGFTTTYPTHKYTREENSDNTGFILCFNENYSPTDEVIYNLIIIYTDGTHEVITITQDHRYENFVKTNEVKCFDTELWEVGKLWYGYTEDNINEGYEEVKVELIEADCEDCGFDKDRIYRTVDGEFMCDGVDKYVERIYQVSTDGGVTWETIDTVWELYEINSEDCGYVPPIEPIYRWLDIPIEEDYECDMETHTKYQIQKKQISLDGYEWQDVVPRETQRKPDGEFVEHSTDCGYEPIEPIYRTIDGEEVCDGFDLYVEKLYQISYDNGVNWLTLSTSYELVEEDSEHCGYVPPIEPIERWSRLPIEDDWYCEEETPTTCAMHYTSTNGNIVTPYSATSIDASIVSNTYTDGQGTIEFDECPTKLGLQAFSGRTTLKSIEILDTITVIGNTAFRSCSGLTSVTIPDSVITIENNAFVDCSSLSSITIPESVTSIGEGALARTKVQTVVFPSKITLISKNVLIETTSLKSVTIPVSVTNIGQGAFARCSNLTSITYNGTKSQWNAITKGNAWKDSVPTSCKVHCTDGDISI